MFEFDTHFQKSLQCTLIYLFLLQWGEDSAEIQINVVGKPDMPGGPLNVTEVTRKSCLLSWKPPADNGGYQITHYEVQAQFLKFGTKIPSKITFEKFKILSNYILSM